MPSIHSGSIPPITPSQVEANHESRLAASQPVIEFPRYGTPVPQTYTQTNIHEIQPSFLPQNWLSKKQMEMERFGNEVFQPTLEMAHTQYQPDFYPDPLPINTYPRMSTLPIRPCVDTMSTPTGSSKSTLEMGVQTDPVLFMDSKSWLSWLSPETLDQWMNVCLEDPSFYQILNHIENHFLYHTSNHT
jgi:hypothetical protein